MLSDFIAWVKIIIGQWQKYLAGGGVIGLSLLILYIIERSLGRVILANELYLLLFIGLTIIWSSFIAWRNENQNVKHLSAELENKKPHLNADFNVAAVAPAGDNDEDAIVMVTAHITNIGSPSIVKNINVVAEKEGRFIQGQFITLDIRGSQFSENLKGKQVTRTVKFEDHLVRNCSSDPIVTGGGKAGAHVVLMRNINCDDIYAEGTVITFSFRDAFDQMYEFKRIMDGRIMPMLNPTMLQRDGIESL